MITRSDIAAVLQSKQGKSQDEKRYAVEVYCDDNEASPEEKEKILDDLESYGGF